MEETNHCCRKMNGTNYEFKTGLSDFGNGAVVF